MTAFRRLADADVGGKRVLVRVDFNTPMSEGKVSDDTRLRAAVPTIADLRDRSAKIVLCAHFGRPKGERKPDMSLAPIAEALSPLIGAPVKFAADCVGPEAEAAARALAEGEVLLLENTRFHAGEEKNAPDFAAQLAQIGEIYVNDAFSAAHRAHASTEGVAKLLPAYAGKAMERELDHLNRALGSPNRPVVAIVGGAKVSTKIAVLENLVKQTDALVIGGAMANTFLAAQGHNMGASLHEPDQFDTAKDIMAAADASGCRIVLPVDGVTAMKFEAHAPSQTRAAEEVQAGEMMLDVGPKTVDLIADAVEAARTVVWNGPMGAFEIAPFDTSTVEVAQYVAKRAREGALTAVAGGGDTVAALNHAGVTSDFTFVSTAGGAFLEWMEGRPLPGVEALR